MNKNKFGINNLQWFMCDKTKRNRGCPRGEMVEAIDCEIVVSEFEFQSRHYVHFRENSLGKGMNPLIPPAMV